MTPDRGLMAPPRNQDVVKTACFAWEFIIFNRNHDEFCIENDEFCTQNDELLLEMEGA